MVGCVSGFSSIWLTGVFVLMLITEALKMAADKSKHNLTLDYIDCNCDLRALCFCKSRLNQHIFCLSFTTPT